MEQSGLSSFCLSVVADTAEAVGCLNMVTCQAHTMQPEVLMHVCLLVGELDVDATDAPFAPAAYSNLFQQMCAGTNFCIRSRCKADIGVTWPSGKAADCGASSAR